MSQMTNQCYYLNENSPCKRFIPMVIHAAGFKVNDINLLARVFSEDKGTAGRRSLRAKRERLTRI